MYYSCEKLPLSSLSVVSGVYLFALPVLDITPHIGLRYTGYRQDRYNVTGNAGDVFNVDKADMDTFTLPLGVRFSRTFETAGGWKVAPQLDLTYIPAMGDVKMDTTAHIPGVALTGASLTGEVFDRHTGEARVALGVAKGNVAFDLGYTFQGSTNRTAHGVNAMLKYSF